MLFGAYEPELRRTICPQVCKDDPHTFYADRGVLSPQFGCEIVDILRLLSCRIWSSLRNDSIARAFDDIGTGIQNGHCHGWSFIPGS